MSKRILLTGGSGFVGSNLARHLITSGHEVHLLLRNEEIPWRLKDIFRDFPTHIADLRNKFTVNHAIREVSPEWVFHLAAYGAYPFQQDVSRMMQTNIIGTANLLNACLIVGFEAFVNSGSSSEYGFNNNAPSENDNIEPNSFYAVTKASATLSCRYAARAYHKQIATLRLYSVYGPYEEPSRLLPTIVLKGLRNEYPPLVNPAIGRDFVYIDDVVQAYVLAASIRNQELGAVYNVGTGIQTTIRDVVETARCELNISAEPKWGSMPERAWDTETWVCENRRIREKLGWQPQVDFKSGFRQMAKWFQENPEIRAKYEARSPEMKTALPN